MVAPVGQAVADYIAAPVDQVLLVKALQAAAPAPAVAPDLAAAVAAELARSEVMEHQVQPGMAALA